MAVLPHERADYAPPSFLNRPLDLSWVNREAIVFAIVLLLSVVAHFFALGRMALHHDESIHAWMSWRFFAGVGSFTCFGGRTANTYCYEPTYHGPALYILTLFSYFLFGDGDAQARIPQAVAGIGMVASVWMLRPYLGARGLLIAAALLAFSPTLLYYTRFARHDGLILLWTLWIVIGFFRFLDTGRPGYLYLLAAGASLAIATHELYYILFFIFGWFLIIRVAFELLPRRTVVYALVGLLAAALIVELWNPRITPSLRAGGLALLFIATAAAGLLMTRVWDETPVVVRRAQALWREQRGALWTALAIFGAIYAVMYSTFFADPRGLLDGLYAGLAYWLGSQQDARRGDQPWFYHIILMTVYEPLALFGSLATAVYLFTRGWGRTARGWRMGAQSALSEDEAAHAGEGEPEATGDGAEAAVDGGDEETEEPAPTAAPHSSFVVAMFPLFLVFWFLGALVAFSWAGEKMPWLVTHIALPGNLLVAWACGRLLDYGLSRLEPGAGPNGTLTDSSSRLKILLVPLLFALTLVALGVAFWRFSAPAADQQGQASLLQGVIPLIIGGVLLYLTLTIAQRVGWRPVLAFSGLTVAALLGAYMIRSTWMVVYDHPDTPVEPLVYVQSSPDVPLIVNDIRELAINQTRNIRGETDPIGGLTMPVIMDAGDPARDGEGSLAWPFQWYFRDFKRLENRTAEFFRDATPDSFIVEPVQPGADRELAPVVMVSKSNMTQTTRTALEPNYVLMYDTKLNWWFPEGSVDRCDVRAPGYSRFYFSYPGGVADALRRCPNVNIEDIPSFADLLAWPFDTSHWASTRAFLLYRTLPAPLRLDGREMEIWIRRDLAGSSETSAVPAAGPVKLVAQAIMGAPGAGEGQLDGPSAAAVDAQGNVYVADTGNHRIQIFAPDGSLIRSVGSFGSGDGQFYEPRGVTVDADGNIYVADTWNARVVKLDANGQFLKSWGNGVEDFGSGRRASPTQGTREDNAARPLDFFGPRGVAVDELGNVYIADTGNKRIVVTDTEGNYRYQWGYFGAEPGAFSEPIGVAVNEQGTVYVADTWNGRVQAFIRESNGLVNPTPIATWRVAGWQPQTYDDPFLAARGDQVVVSVPGRNAVSLADSTGKELLRWGGAGSDLASLNLPSGVAFAPDGTIYVVDRGNARVMQFKLPLPGR